MNYMSHLTRRGWLKIAVGTVGTFLLSQYDWLTWLPRRLTHSREEILWNHVQRIFPHTDSARIIGRKYLQCRSCEADAKQLTNLIAPKKQLASIAEGETGLANFKDFIRTRIREDFLDERIVTLEGWVLSLTEVRLCSLLVVKTNRSFSIV